MKRLHKDLSKILPHRNKGCSTLWIRHTANFKSEWDDDDISLSDGCIKTFVQDI